MEWLVSIVAPPAIIAIAPPSPGGTAVSKPTHKSDSASAESDESESDSDADDVESVRVHLSSPMYASSSALKRAIQSVGWTTTNEQAAAQCVFALHNPSRGVLLPSVILNRFPSMLTCCGKGTFATLLERVRALLPPDAPLRESALIPMQWSLPRSATQFRSDFQRMAEEAARNRQPSPTFIIKADQGGSGEGVEVTNQPLRSLYACCEAVIQRYISSPMLIDGLKFDLRLYVLLTSVGGDDGPDAPPMRAFLCREGMARFAVSPYPVHRQSGAPTRLHDVHAHLTNYSLNKSAAGFRDDGGEADGGEHGSKRTASSVLAALEACGRIPSVQAVWRRIELLVCRALAVIQPTLACARRQSCGAGGGGDENGCGRASRAFQVLGVDVLLDDAGRPWLLELNDHPSVRVDQPSSAGAGGVAGGGDGGGGRAGGGGGSVSVVDERIKVPMLADALRIVAAVHGLPCAPRESPWELAELAGLCEGEDVDLAYGTTYVELRFPPDLISVMTLFDRLRSLFERHTPPSTARNDSMFVLRRPAWATAGGLANGSGASTPPRWRVACLARFLRAYAGLPYDVTERIFSSLCTRGPGALAQEPSMDVMDFAEACSAVAQRLHREAQSAETRQELCQASGNAESEPSVLLQRLLNEWTVGDAAAEKYKSWLSLDHMDRAGDERPRKAGRTRNARARSRSLAERSRRP